MTKIKSERQGETTMLKNILIIMIVAITALIGITGTARAMISEPDVIYFGTALTAAVGDSVKITLDGAATSVASFNVGSNLKYVLRVPMDALGARLSGTARTGDVAVVTINGAVAAKVVIPARGTLVKLDVSKRGAEQWALDHPGDSGSGDRNRNGISDLQEYLDGNDPASCVWTTIDATSAETTVYHADVLKSCLKEAEADQKHNLVRLARGTYGGNFGYVAGWKEDFDLTLIGGYNPDGTPERIFDPALTILTGDTDGDGIGNGVVLAIDTDSGKTSGKVHVESVTIRNGVAGQNRNGGGLRAQTYKGALELAGNIFTGNSAESGSGGAVVVAVADSGAVLLTNNVVYGNTAMGAAAAQVVSWGNGEVMLLNNTIADNRANAAGEGRSVAIQVTTATVDLTNNIVLGSSAVSGAEIYVNSAGVAIPLTVASNDFDAVGGLLANAPGFALAPSNIDSDPKFTAPLAGNYRLKSGSPCIDKGTGHGRLTAKDIIGSDRVLDAAVDLGAYEFKEITNGAISLENLRQTYDGTAKTIKAVTSPPGLAVTVTYDGAVQAPVSAGSHGVAATIADPGYTGPAVTVTGTLIIDKQASALAFGQPGAVAFGGAPVDLSAFVTPGASSAPVTFGVISGSGTLGGTNNKMLTIAGAGAIVIQADQAADANYLAAAPVRRTVTVNKAAQSLTFNQPASVSFGGGPVDLSGYVTPGASSSPVAFSVISGPGTLGGVNNRMLTIAGAGAIVIQADQAADANYLAAALVQKTVAAAKASQAITFVPPASVIFGDAPLVFSASGGGSANPVTFAVSGGPGMINGNSLAVNGAGRVTITASQAGSADYLAAADVQRTIEVAKAEAAVVLANLKQVYDGMAKSISATTNPTGKSVTFTYDGSAAAPAAPGSYTVVGTIVDANYQGSATAKLVISETGAPVLSVSTLANGTLTSAPVLNVSGNVSDEFGVKSVTVNGQSVTLTNGGFTTAITLAPGQNVITVVATDLGDNTAADTRTVTLDANAPTLLITSPADNSVIGRGSAGGILMTGAVSELAAVQARVGGGAWQNAQMNGTSFNIQLVLVQGQNTVEVMATDAAGNSSAVTAKRTLFYDSIAPALAITSPVQDSATARSAVVLTGTVSDAVGVPTVTVYHDGFTYTPSVSSGVFSQTLMLGAVRSYPVVVTATDSANNSSQITRTIVLAPHNVTVVPGAGGGITGNASQSITEGGEIAPVVAVPNSGYSFVNWTGNNDFVATSVNPLVVNGVTGPVVVTANFSANPVNALCGASNGGSFAFIPSSGLCTTGHASVVSGAGSWYWTCSGINGGAPEYCSAGLLGVNTMRDGVVVPDSGKLYPDVSDALRVLQIAYGKIAPTDSDLSHADIAPRDAKGVVIGNGVIDVYDVIGILRMSVGLN